MSAKIIPVLLLALALVSCTTQTAARVVNGGASSVELATPAATSTHSIPPSPPSIGEVFTATSLPAFASTPFPGPNIMATSTVAYDSDAPLAASGCNESAYVSDVTIEDGAELAPGQVFTKTWELKNIGTCKWSKAYSMTFVSGDDMDGVGTEISRAIDSGETARISVDLTAPGAPGTYRGYWVLADKGGNVFGEKVYVTIVVSGDAAASTATSASTVMPTKSRHTSTPASIPPSPTSAPTDTLPTTPGS